MYQKNKIMKMYQSYLKEYSEGIMGYQALAIIGQSCLGSVAAMLILSNGVSFGQMFQLFIITALCLSYNGSIFSQQKPKVSFNILIISVVASILLSILNSI